VEFCVILHWTDIAVLLAIVLSGCTVAYFVLHRLVRQNLSKKHAEVQQELLALTGTLHSLEARLAQYRDSAAAISPAAEIETSLSDRADEARIEADQETLAPEILATIAAAATAFLGRHAQIRSVSPSSAQAVSPWSQQGRVFVQASHNLRTRR